MECKKASKKLSVLIVDDSDVDRMQCRRLMKPALESGWTLSDASSMQEAITLSQDHSFHCILLDYHLPDGNGLEHVKMLAKTVPQSAVIILTGGTDKGIDYEAESLGAADYLLKDELTQDQLLRTIRYATSRTKLLHQYQKAAQEALMAYQAKQSFLLAASHELRTPLQHLLGFSEALEMGLYGELTQPQQVVMMKMNESAKVLSEAVEDTLAVAQYSSGSIQMKTIDVDLNCICQNTIQRFEFAALDKGIDLVFHPSTTPMFIAGDPIKLYQAIRQLVGNAIKHTITGDVNVRLEPGPAISIEDTGPGFSADPYRTIQVFLETLHNSNSRIPEGFGYGIALANEILLAHKAELKIESKAEKGTLVKILFSENVQAS